MKKIKPTTHDLMTLREAQSALGKVSYATVWKWARDGHLPAITIARKRFILRGPFMKLLSNPGRPAA